ncbi:MAG: NUDIX domain-containing protein [Phycisphaerales bacterium]|nr:NUDIX domain-containing protein [Phycisphaerales bacterium]
MINGHVSTIEAPVIAERVIEPAGTAGYRAAPAGGPRLRADVVDVYVFRRVQGPGTFDEAIEFLQLLRNDEPLKGTWHPVMGHIEHEETAPQCAVRELSEELGLRFGAPDLLGFWALEQVHPFYIAAIDSIVLSPRFAVEVSREFRPVLDVDHAAHRWVGASEAWRRFMWPGQIATVREIIDHLLRPGSLAKQWLRL